MQYLELGLEIKHDLGQDYWVGVNSSEGEAYITIRLPLDIAALNTPYRNLPESVRLEELRRQFFSSLGQSPQAVGQRLFDALMVGQLRTLYALTREKAERQQMGVRLRLWFLTPELAALPWEYLYDVDQQAFLALSTDTSLVRSALFSRPMPQVTVSLPLRVLAMGVRSTTAEREAERVRLERIGAPLEVERRIELRWFGRAARRNADRAANNGPWHIFHLVGDTQHLWSWETSEMGRLLAEHSSLQIAVINMEGYCDLIAAKLAQWTIPAVLSVPGEINSDAQVAGIQTLYQAFAEGKSADEAVTSMRQAIRTVVPETLDWGRPVFYMQATDGNLFDFV